MFAEHGETWYTPHTICVQHINHENRLDSQYNIAQWWKLFTCEIVFQMKTPNRLGSIDHKLLLFCHWNLNAVCALNISHSLSTKMFREICKFRATTMSIDSHILCFIHMTHARPCIRSYWANAAKTAFLKFDAKKSKSICCHCYCLLYSVQIDIMRSFIWIFENDNHKYWYILLPTCRLVSDIRIHILHEKKIADEQTNHNGKFCQSLIGQMENTAGALCRMFYFFGRCCAKRIVNIVGGGLLIFHWTF